MQKLVKDLTEVRHREDQLKSEGSSGHMLMAKIKNGKDESFYIEATWPTIVPVFCIICCSRDIH
jgi:hypothetical protein